jgi:hypothetical protein
VTVPLFDRFRRILKKADDETWPSIVFLLLIPHLPSREEALQLARDAWGPAGPIELAGMPRAHSFLLRTSQLMFALHAAPSRYEIDRTDLPAAQLQPWDQHTAWLAVDLPGKRTAVLRQQGSLGGAYAALMYFAFKYWSPNCLALYFPDEGTTVPNHGDVIESIRWSRRNGIDLRFLRDSNQT